MLFIAGPLSAGVTFAFVPGVLTLLSSKDLKEKRAVKFKEANDLLALVRTAERELTAEERTKHTAYMTELDEFDTQIQNAERWEARQAKMAGQFINQENKKQEEKEMRGYSILRAIRQCVDGGNVEGLEKEMHEEAVREARRSGIEINGFGVPLSALNSIYKVEKRDYSATGSTSGAEGGVLIPTQIGAFISGLMNRLVLTKLGTTYLSDLMGTFQIPRVTQTAAAWVSTEIGSNSEVQGTWDKLTLTPHRLGSYSQIARQLIHQTSLDVEKFVQDDIIRATAIALEAAAINGPGSGGAPTGILNTASIGSYAMGTNGLAPDYTSVVGLETAVATPNADLGALAYLINAKTRGKYKGVPKISGYPTYIWDGGETPLNGYPVAVSNNVPANLTKGTSTGICSAAIFGNFNDLVIGQWGGLDIVVDPYVNAINAIINVYVNSFWDVAVRHPESFAACKDYLTT
jgi:HK97 family phage major capsid protein